MSRERSDGKNGCPLISLEKSFSSFYNCKLKMSTDTQQATMTVLPDTRKVPNNPNQQEKIPKKKGKMKNKPRFQRRKKTADPSKPVPLNLNNEVVRMRKEVKRVRVLVLRKVLKHIEDLKRKKGAEKDLERNQRKIARLLEEVQVMKSLTPDSVTKAALQKQLSFEIVCKDPKSTATDRATARIATHPQFSNKIDVIKAAIQAFKDERMATINNEQKPGENESVKKVKVTEKLKDNAEKESVDKGDKEGGQENKEETEKYEVPTESQSLRAKESAVIFNHSYTKEASTAESKGSLLENLESPTENLESPAENLESPAENLESPAENLESPAENLESPAENLESPAENLESPAENLESPIENLQADSKSEMSEALKTLIDPTTPFTLEAPQIAPIKKIETQKHTPRKTVETTPRLTMDKPAPRKTKTLKPPKDSKRNEQDLKKQDESMREDDEDDGESDLESSEDDGEYFDDSTEERFQKEALNSEERDNDDFFLGKVTKFKKKSDIASAPPGAVEGTSTDMGTNPLLQPLDSFTQDRLEERVTKASFRSVFCSSLSGSRGMGRGGGRGMGQWKSGGWSQKEAMGPRWRQGMESNGGINGSNQKSQVSHRKDRSNRG
ncbi:hypothetical protein UPYG_G00331560 [Umbra pygmaea]|uniref:Serum response factor-binding protein 1 n=1 Tax=Umbra pygmaea TaxID=75934 RepID=A0ABD0VZP8_UMBPY